MNKIPSYFGTPKYVKNDTIRNHYLLNPVPQRPSKEVQDTQSNRPSYYNSHDIINKCVDFEIDDY